MLSIRYLPDATSYCCSKSSTVSHFTWSKSSSHYNSLQDLKWPPSHPYLSDLFCNSPSYSPKLPGPHCSPVTMLLPLPECPRTGCSLLSTWNALSPQWLTSSPSASLCSNITFQQGLSWHFCWKRHAFNSMSDPPSCPTLNFLFLQHLSPTALAQFPRKHSLKERNSREAEMRQKESEA